MARNKKVEILSHSGEVLHPITDGDCVIFPDGETLTHKLSEDEAVMYTPEVVNSSPMFKVGEGDSSDYSANVLDGAYQEAVLKGQTYVNTIQEPSADVITLPTPFTEYERTQSKTFTEMQDGTFGLNLVGQSYVNCIQEPSEPSYVALGENLEFQNKKVEYTADGQIKSAMLNGMTLVNISKTNSFTINSTTWKYATLAYPLQTAKTYFIIADVENNTLNGKIKIVGNSNTWLNSDFVDVGKIGRVATKITPSTDINSFAFYSDTMTSGSATFKAMIIEYQEGMENWDIPYFQGMQSVTMTTELENVCSRYNSSGAKNGKTFTVGTWETRGLTLSTTDNIAKYNFKPNTKYLVQFKVTNLNLDGLSSIGIAFSDGEVSTGNSLFGDNALVEVKSNGIYRGILTTSNVISTSNFVIKGFKNQWENSTSTTRKITISQIMYIEYQNGMENWDLPYFETTQLMKPVKVQTTSKNLCGNSVKLGQYRYDGTNLFSPNIYNDSETQICANESPIRIKPNTSYTLSKDYSDTFRPRITFFSRKGEMVLTVAPNASNTSFTSPSDAYYFVFNSNTNTPIDVALNGKYQLEESSTETPYIPHQEKTISALEPITLRAIGNVKDTLDLSTGEYVQRFDEVVLDGSSDESITMWFNKENNVYFGIGKINNVYKPRYEKLCMVCDKLPTPDVNPKQFEEGDYEGVSVWDDNFPIVIGINKNRLQGTTVSAFRQWLQQNPIKIQYRIVTTTRKISLEYPNLQTYQDITHVQSIAMDGTLIPNIYLPSDISYKAMLKPNTSYNVIVDREVIDSTNQLTVNLGGTTANITANRTVVRTPSTLSNETLTFSGKDNRLAKAMLIEGSTLINGDLPHFDGIGDVKLGRIVENLCLSNEYPKGNGGTTDTYSNNSITSKFTVSGSRVYLFDLIKPIQNGKKYFVYAPCSLMCSIGFKTVKDESSLYSVAKTNITNYAILSVDNEILTGCQLFIGQLGAMAVGSTMTIRRPILCEYIKGMENWDWESIGYFTGARNIGNEFMRIGNKNLFDSEIKHGSVNFNVKYPWYVGVSKNRAYGNRIYKIKNNTNYTVSLNLTEKSNYKIAIHFSVDGYTLDYDSTWHTYPYNFNSHEYNYISLYFARQDDAVITDSEIANLKKAVQLEEASSATSYVEHKHNALYLPKDESVPLTWEQGSISYSTGGSWADATNNTNTTRIRTQLLDLEPNETYRVSYGGNGYKYAIGFYNNSNMGSSVLTTTTMNEYYFTTTKDVHKIGIVVTTSNDGNITPSALHQVRLEKVTDIHLRSVGSVKDELDLTRGVCTQRIGEVVLNGSIGKTNKIRDIKSVWSPIDNMYAYAFYLVNDKFKSITPDYSICDSLKGVDWTSLRNSGVKAYTLGNGDNDYIAIRSNLSTLDELKQYLQQNPITVQYILKTPIEHKIHIPMKNESNQIIAKPNGIFTLPLMHSGNNHVDINSQIYPKVESRDYISYPVIASPSTKYTVFHNKVGSTDLTVNLCGASTTVDTHKNTITTPSSISQYELRLSGATNKVSNVCVFNGDYMNVNVPYMQGMMNAVNPTVKNIGKNLFNKNNIVQNYYLNSNGGLSQEIGTERNATDYIQIKPNTSYIIDGARNSGITNNNRQFYVAYYDKYKNCISKYIPFVESIITLKTPSNAYYLRTTVKNKDLDNFILMEQSSTLSQYEPYKENNCEPDYGQVYLTQDMLEQGAMYYSHGNSYSSMINNTDTSRIRLKKLLCLKENTTYVIKIDGDYMFALGLFNENEIGVSSSSVSTWKNEYIFTTTSDACKLGFCIRKSSNGAIRVSEFNDCNITLYELDKEIHLRSLPNGVRDELNLETGEYIQRIGEIVLDGSENWTNGNKGNEYTTLFAVTGLVRFDDKNVNFPAISDRYVYNVSLYGEDNVVEGFFTAWSGFYIRIGRDKVSTNIEDFKQYLSQNPITVQYELKEPIVKDIVIHNYPHSYQNGHVIIESGDPTTSVPAQLTYKCVTNRSGQIQEHTEQVEKQERQINELETLILENIRQQQNRSQNFLTSLISTLEIEEE